MTVLNNNNNNNNNMYRIENVAASVIANNVNNVSLNIDDNNGNMNILD